MTVTAWGQEEQEIQDVPEAPKHHFIEMFRPLYIVSGIPVTEKPTLENADVKFQVSLELPLWRDMRGSGIDLSVAYTQISVWNLYAPSSPFYDNAYIPGVFCRKVWNGADGLPRHTALWGIEHRSNGRSDAYSRSINYVLATRFSLDHGYLTLEGTWQKGSEVTIDIPMTVKLLEANPLVEEARGQVAVQRGPIVYCAESQDLGGADIDALQIPLDATFTPVETRIDGSRLMALECEAIVRDQASWSGALYRPAATAKHRQTIRLIPYYAWGNRGKSEMTVWMPAGY